MAPGDNHGDVDAMPSALRRVVNETSSVQSKVAAAIRDAILTGGLRPGQRLIQREICEQTGASRAAVREALSSLTAEGLVEQLPQGGMIVPLIESKKAAEIYELRAALEGLVTRLYVERSGASDHQVLREALARLEDAVANSDERAFLVVKNHFYQELIRGAGNEELRIALTRLHGRIALLRSITVSHPGRLKQSIEEFRQLMSFVESGHAQQAAEVAVMHVRSAAEVAQKSIDAGLQHELHG